MPHGFFTLERWVPGEVTPEEGTWEVLRHYDGTRTLSDAIYSITESKQPEQGFYRVIQTQRVLIVNTHSGRKPQIRRWHALSHSSLTQMANAFTAELASKSNSSGVAPAAEISFRAGGISDAPAIARFEIDCIVSLGKIAADQLETEEQLRCERWVSYLCGERTPELGLEPRFLVIAQADKQVIGYAAVHLTKKWGASAEVQSIYVAPKFQRKGTGTELLHRVVRWSQAAGAECLGAQVMPRNPYKRFYVKHGGDTTDTRVVIWNDLEALELSTKPNSDQQTLLSI